MATSTSSLLSNSSVFTEEDATSVSNITQSEALTSDWTTSSNDSSSESAIFSTAKELLSTENNNNTTVLYNDTSTTDSSNNSTLISMMQSTLTELQSTANDSITTATSYIKLTKASTQQSTLLDITSAPTSEEALEAGFTSMQKWFIATGSVILAVIVLFFINTCIQYRGVFQKLAKDYKDKKFMADLEKRTKHRPGGDDAQSSGTTHIFVHHMFMKKDKT